MDNNNKIFLLTAVLVVCLITAIYVLTDLADIYFLLFGLLVIFILIIFNYNLKRKLTELESLYGLLEKSKKEAEFNAFRMELLTKLNELSDASYQDIVEFAIEGSIQLTQSKIGYFALYHNDTDILEMIAWSRVAMELCKIQDKSLEYPLNEAGLWGEAVRQRKPLITNDFKADNPYKKGYPVGHVEVLSHFNVPIFDHGRVVAVSGVGNKETDYNESDVLHLTLFMTGVYRLLQRKETEEKLKAQNQELLAKEEQLLFEQEYTKNLVDSSPSIVVSLNKDGLVNFINPAGEEITGYSKDELIGKNWFKVIFKENQQDQVTKIQKQLFDKGTMTSHCTEITTKQGDCISLQCSAFCRYNRKGEVSEIIGYANDISQLIEARRDAEMASKYKGEFLANMSHEIRTPLNGIIGLIDLLFYFDKPSKRQTEYIPLIKSSCQSLMSIINDILDFSKIEVGKLELVQSSFNLRNSLDNLVQSFSVGAFEKKIDFVYKYSLDLPESFIGDSTRLNQIIINLLQNALKFTSKGEIYLSVEKEKETKDKMSLHFIISDTGIGIPEDKKLKIFEAFTQADSSTTKKYGGTGLGLSISSSLVKLMDGKIWLESVEGKGSTFHFIVDLIKEKECFNELKTYEEISLESKGILIIDNNEKNHKVIEELLTYYKVNVYSAPSVNSAISLIEDNNNIDLILFDQKLIEMDNLKATNKRLKNIPMVVMVSSYIYDLQEFCEVYELFCCIRKPFRKKDLLQILNNLARQEVRL